MHLDQAAVDALSPAAKQVTEGELMALWGAPDQQAALQTYQTSGGTWTPSQATDAAPLDLTVSDHQGGAVALQGRRSIDDRRAGKGGRHDRAMLLLSVLLRNDRARAVRAGGLIPPRSRGPRRPAGETL